jgi:fermentation-respiration switch protein FrsA (DUF1100 family)
MQTLMQTAFLVMVGFLLVAPALPQSLAPGKNELMLRGRKQGIYYYPARSKGAIAPPVLFLPGDGGWRGFAVEIAESLATFGYDVYGWDTKQYLIGFTSGETTLKEVEIMADVRSMARNITGGKAQKIALLGWSEGAGIALLGAAASRSNNVFSGLVSIGMPGSAVLGWRLADNLTYLTKKEPNEPTFATAEYLPQVSPLPLVMIHSTHDEYISTGLARQLFDGAREPKRLFLVEARNHRYDGNREQFLRVLREALQWIGKTEL